MSQTERLTNMLRVVMGWMEKESLYIPDVAVRSGELQDRKSKDDPHSIHRECWSLRITMETTCGSYARKPRISESVSYRVASLRGGRWGQWTWQLASVLTYGIAWCREIRNRSWCITQKRLLACDKPARDVERGESDPGMTIHIVASDTKRWPREKARIPWVTRRIMPCRAIMHPSGNHSLIQLLSKPNSALVDGVCHLCTCRIWNHLVRSPNSTIDFLPHGQDSLLCCGEGAVVTPESRQVVSTCISLFQATLNQ